MKNEHDEMYNNQQEDTDETKFENEASQAPNFTMVEDEANHKEADIHQTDEKVQIEEVKATVQDEIPHVDIPKDGFYKRHRSKVLVAACLLVGGAGGFGGTYLANSVSNQGGNGKTVLYQSVQTTDTNGNNVTTMSVKDVVTNTSNSVVEITTESVTNDQFMQQAVTQGAGSGVIISKDGYIVTNNHVVSGATKISVRTKDGTSYTATLIGTDAKTDLAVIKIDANDLQAAILGTSSNLSVGDEAIAIGNPLGELGGTVTKGIISALDREITIDGQTMTLLQTDTAINPGNSGGGLFNESGELIGIVNAKTSGSSVEGLGFAIPIDIAKPVIESLISNGYVTGRPQLGVSMVNITSETSAFQAGVNELGVYIAKVNADSAADKAGLEVRDRVIRVDDQEISSSSDISKIVDSKKVGDTITLVVERDGKEVKITATLQEAVQDTTSKESSNSSSNSRDSIFPGNN